MSLKKKMVCFCDYCQAEIYGDPFIMKDAANEGCSTIRQENKSYEFSDKDFCSLECFFNDIKAVFE